ncbi:MAG: PaaI family thioesterase [Hyphomicrobiales bacterium]|nr:PaaI family thioesterase [Hyphomicrobiales bacterium]
MESERAAPALDARAVEAVLREHFPQARAGEDFVVEAIGPMSARLRLAADERFLRPGGTVSGPALFALADIALYCAVLGEIGAEPLAVTTNMSINFFRKAPLGGVVAEARLFKVGRTLAVGEVSMRGVEGALIAHATGTYALPPKRR